VRWWRRGRTEPEPEQPTPEQDSAERPVVREAERRRLARLVQRREELLYDLAQSEQALQPENRWTERLRELEAAIAELEKQVAALEGVSLAAIPSPLPALPVDVTVELDREPVSVTVEIAGVRLRWVEEIDWAERGHQVAPARLRQTEGEVIAVLRAAGYPSPPPLLIETLAASLDLVAADAVEAARRRQVWTRITLAELARPCEGCGGWRDVRGRCATCTAREWQRQQLLLERNRLRQERDEVFRDWQRARDRLPVIRRQLAEVEADIRQLEAKGVRLTPGD